MWIAKSSVGGICVLLYDAKLDNGAGQVGASCSSPERLDRGATVEITEIPGAPGEVVAAGVVPGGVTAVETLMVDGTTSVAPVIGNAWARITHSARVIGRPANLKMGA